MTDPGAGYRFPPRRDVPSQDHFRWHGDETSALRHALDFRHHESWRLLTPVVADELIRFTGQGLVAVQTVLHEQYWDELETGLVARGHKVFHVVLEADADEVRRRIDTDEVEVTAKAWRHQHLPVYDKSREWLIHRADLVVNTNELDPSEAASQILVSARHEVVS